MFGINMRIKHKDQVVLLRPFSKKDLPILVDHFSSMKIHMNTKGLFSQTIENEDEWYEKNRKDESSCVWAIQPESSEFPIGVTALHHITSRLNSCSSGIVIWDSNWWGKGIATATHLCRTAFAADFLNRFMIKSCVRVENTASRKALERVGYTIWGTEPLSTFRRGLWQDSDHLLWIHPEKVYTFCPIGLPSKYDAGIEKANNALKLARAIVEFP